LRFLFFKAAVRLPRNGPGRQRDRGTPHCDRAINLSTECSDVAGPIVE
jgi:hypothetical protein